MNFLRFLNENHTTHNIEDHIFNGHDGVATAETHLLALRDILLGKKTNGIKFHNPMFINPKNFTPEEQTDFLKHLNNARKSYLKLKPEAFDVLGDGISHISKHIKSAESIDDLINHITRKRLKESDDEHSKIIDHLLTHRDHANSTIELHNHLRKAREVLHNVIARSGAAEGHVKMSDENGNKSKLKIEGSKSLRKGISHPKDLKYDDVMKLLSTGRLKGSFTEKTDGMALAVGYDENGFYTRSSHSGKMRKAGDYREAIRQKFGDDADPTVSSHFDRIHKEMERNPKLMKYLQDTYVKNKRRDTLLKGEVFYRPFGTPSEDKKGIRFVGTTYDPKHLGKTGAFVLHSKLPENEGHDPEIVKSLGNKDFNFDHDIISNGHLDVPVHDLKDAFSKINGNVINSRKHSDKELKEREREKVKKIALELENRMRKHTDTLKGKWGPETEGHVFHSDVDAPLIKLTSNTFRDFKAAQKEQKNGR